jgi:hypothetical protein
MKDEMIFPISIRVIQYIKKDFEKIGIIIPVTSGFKFKKININKITTDEKQEEGRGDVSSSKDIKSAQYASESMHNMHTKNSQIPSKNSCTDNILNQAQIYKFLISQGITDFQYKKYIAKLPKEHVINRIKQYFFVKKHFPYRIKISDVCYLFNSITKSKWLDRDYLRHINEANLSNKTVLFNNPDIPDINNVVPEYNNMSYNDNNISEEAREFKNNLLKLLNINAA